MADAEEIWIWEADGLLKANEFLKGHLDADVVALTQLIAGSEKVTKQIRLLGVAGRAYVKVGKNGKRYVIFKGYPGLRPNLNGTRYAIENPKIASFVVGNRAIIEDAMEGTKIAVIAFVAIDIIKELREDKPSLASLGVRVLSDVLQAVVAAAAGAAVGVVLTTLGAPTVIAFAIVVGTGFAVGVLLTEIDRRYQLTEMARTRMVAWERDTTQRIAASAQRAIDTGKQMVRLGELLVEDVVVAYYTVDRVWRTVEEFKGSRYRPR